LIRKTEEERRRREEKKYIPETVGCGSFSIGKYPVTFEQYDHYCEETGKRKPEDEGWGRGKRPVINVSWHEAVEYCEWLSKRTGESYRLPNESEWEYAAKGGNECHEYKYSGSNKLEEVGWYRENSREKTQPVELKKANELGIYDMSGNVWEWYEDWYDSDRNYKVLRGGSWFTFDIYCSVSYRIGNDPDDSHDDVGLRITRD